MTETGVEECWTEVVGTDISSSSSSSESSVRSITIGSDRVPSPDDPRAQSNQ